jgi:hypothetical protein
VSEGKVLIADVLASARPRETEVQLCLSGDLAAEADRLKARLDEMRPRLVTGSLADVDPRVAVEAELDEVHALMRENLVTFRFRSLGHKAWSDLKAEHPGRDSDELWNPDTMAAALVAASAIEPEMTLADVEALFEIVNASQRGELWAGAYGAQVGETRVPFSPADSRSTSSSGER